MISMRDIARRKTSIQSTEQITKAMKLVSTAKFQKAKENALKTKPYFDYMYKTVSSILGRAGNISHRYLVEAQSKQNAVIVITSNRGLAGGYNSNIIKLLTKDDRFNKENTKIYAIGTKGRDALERRGYAIIKDYSEVMNHPIYADARDIGMDVLHSFERGEIGQIYLAYTSLESSISQIPALIKLLPLKRMETDIDSKASLMNFEPKAEEALDLIIPKYIYSLIYGGLVESLASENGARMTAMESATSNAEELIEDLSLKYNRARQSSITNELTEIIAGSEAIET